MNWVAVVLVVYVAMGVEMGLKRALELGETGMSPGLVMPVLVFFGMFGPIRAMLWVGLLTGLVLDLTTPWGSTAMAVAGPNALGCLCAVLVVQTLRGLMIRRNPLSVAVLSVIAMAVSQIVVVAFFTMRGLMSDAMVWDATGELVRRLGSSLYTGLTGLVVGVLLTPGVGVFGFPDVGPRRFGRRG